jgi:hypothetical protein
MNGSEDTSLDNTHYTNTREVKEEGFQRIRKIACGIILHTFQNNDFI